MRGRERERGAGVIKICKHVKNVHAASSHPASHPASEPLPSLPASAVPLSKSRGLPPALLWCSRGAFSALSNSRRTKRTAKSNMKKIHTEGGKKTERDKRGRGAHPEGGRGRPSLGTRPRATPPVRTQTLSQREREREGPKREREKCAAQCACARVTLLICNNQGTKTVAQGAVCVCVCVSVCDFAAQHWRAEQLLKAWERCPDATRPAAAVVMTDNSGG